jgi:DNA-3-methyladenine glycosylase I
VNSRNRCPWPGTDPLYVAYHDREWGVPVRDDRALFEHLVLDGAQAGLSWITILRRREGYRAAFAGFDPERMARFDGSDVARLLQDTRIIRNRAKIESAIRNARAFLRVQETSSGFSHVLWSFVDGEPVRNAWREPRQVPAATPASHAMSKALRQAGFSFVGPTICYAFMQAAGLVNDHLVDCFRYSEIG